MSATANPTMPAKFDRIADYYDDTRGGLARGERFASVVSPWLGSRCLEIGVGTGAVAAGVRAPGRTIVGIDVSAGMLRHTGGRVDGAVRGSAERLPFGADSFSGVYAVWMMHMVDLERALAEVARVLRPGGRFLTVPAANPPTAQDPIGQITWAMQRELYGPGLTRDSPAQLGEQAARHGLRLTGTDEVRQTYTVIPAEVADNIERRGFSNLPDVDDERWRTVAGTALSALRALPGQQEPFERVTAHSVGIFEKAGNGSAG